MRRDVPFYGGRPIERADGESPRAALARRAREKIGRASGRDMSTVSDTESLDLIEYMLFPNMVPGAASPCRSATGSARLATTRRSRSWRSCSSFPKPPTEAIPSLPPSTGSREDEPWSAAAEMGSAAMVADQDTDNLMRIQRGLRATKKPGVTLARYQESRIRHFHQTLDRYMGRS